MFHFIQFPNNICLILLYILQFPSTQVLAWYNGLHCWFITQPWISGTILPIIKEMKSQIGSIHTLPSQLLKKTIGMLICSVKSSQLVVFGSRWTSHYQSKAVLICFEVLINHKYQMLHLLYDNVQRHMSDVILTQFNDFGITVMLVIKFITRTVVLFFTYSSASLIQTISRFFWQRFDND